jgi:excisionase family DNA binding protein
MDANCQVRLLFGSARTTPAYGAENVSLGDFLDKRATALTVSEVAEILNISERQVYKLASLNVIPCFRVGSSIRFDPSQVAAWLRQKAAPISVRPGEERRKRA